jgi:O-acetyl-ADP-ribose deacetylase (regulator of RNase III)
MPYGKKKVGRRTVDFDKVYDEFHKPLIDDLCFVPIRCDRLDDGGSIHLNMFQNIYDCGLVLVDLTSCNPNVMYELGVRHTLNRSSTVMLRQVGTVIPFNISGYPILVYDASDPQSRKNLRRSVAKRINDLHMNPGEKSDSPVLDKLKIAIVDDSPRFTQATKTETTIFNLHGHAHDRICVIKGDLKNVKGIDIWVNSENTYMEMARPIEQSVSSFIRYFGSRRNRQGGIVEDKIYNAVMAQRKKSHTPFAPASVLVTDSGELMKSHQVTKILHVAAVHSGPLSGFKPVDQLADCITNSLNAADKLKIFNSILFPLFGTGHARGSLETTVPILMDAAIEYLKSKPNSPIDAVNFLAQTERQAEVCINYLKSHPNLKGPI